MLLQKEFSPDLDSEPAADLDVGLDLDGIWEACPDPSGSSDPLHLTNWKPMRVPANWHIAGLPNYAGVVWFRRQFTLPPNLALRPLRLDFQGVDYQAEVWLDEVLLGEHTSYFQNFSFPVMPLEAEEHLLWVRVNSPKEPPEAWPTRKTLIKGIFAHHDCRPGGSDPKQDGNTGGIWNSVRLVPQPRVQIERLQASTNVSEDEAELTLQCALNNTSDEMLEVYLNIHLTPDDSTAQAYLFSQAVTVPMGTQTITLTEHLEHPRLWWTWDHGEPHLYTLTASLLADGELIDRTQTQIGIREISLEAESLWRLNGRRIFIRGINIIPEQWLSQYTPERIEQDIALLTEAHVNAIRVHAHVNRREFYTACDRAGILVWQDFPLQWGYNVTPSFIAEADRQIRDMVRMLANHPSIALWCCHNEPFYGNRSQLDPILEEAVSEEDTSRPIIRASDTAHHVYCGWFEGRVDHYIGLPGGPLVTEYGAQALPDADHLREMLPASAHWPVERSDWEPWSYHNFQYEPTFLIAGIERGATLEEFVANSQAYQAELLKEATERYRANKYAPITGLFAFMFVECWPSITYAIVDYQRTPKAGYHALRTAFQPVLVTFRGGLPLPRNAIANSWDLMRLTRVVIVNDLPQSFPGARVQVVLDTGTGERPILEETLDLPPDSVVKLSTALQMLEDETQEYFQSILRPAAAALTGLTPGAYWLRARVYTADGSLLSENAEYLRLEPGPEGGTPF
jgi:beta-mannosidase